jgi:hypothetical protein
MRFVFAQRLEGSRFTTYLTNSLYLHQRSIRPKKALTSGSRERPTGLQLYQSGTNEILRHRANGSLRDVPGSRLISHVLAGLALRRMLRGWRDTRQSGLPDEASRSLNDGAKSGSPPDVGQSRAPSLCKNE